MPSFRLDKEPWIPVVMLDGSAAEMSLVAVFEQAGQIATIGGSPLEVAATLRLVLGIAHAAHTPANFGEWGDFWSKPDSFTQACVKYIHGHDVWDLFDPNTPFLQDPRLRGGTIRGAEFNSAATEPVEPTFLNRGKLGTDAFVWHSAGQAVPLSPAQAARALIVTHAFAVGGTGTPNPLIPKAKSGQDDKYSKSSLLAQSIVVFAETSPLDRLLLLNLLTNVPVGIPGWRFPPVESREPVPCTGIADRYTRAAATILLYPEEDGCVQVATLTIGPTFGSDDAIDDPMVPHSRYKDEYKPLRLDRSRALWRSAHVLLAESERPLLILSQLRRLVSRGVLTGQQVRLRVVGIAGEPGKVKHYLWRDECLPLGLSILSDSNVQEGGRVAALQRSISSADKTASDVRKRIYSFAARYLQNGAEANPDKADVGRLADELSPDLHDYWSMLAPMGERIACDDFDESRWAELLKAASDTAYHKAIDRLPPDARRFRAEYARSQSKEKATV